MEYRQLGRSGLKVSALTLGTMTFGGKGRFAFVGKTNAADASRMVDMALDAGVNLLDTSDIYSTGASEEIVGQTIKGKRDNCADRDQGTLPNGRWAERCRPFATPPHPCL